MNSKDFLQYLDIDLSDVDLKNYYEEMIADMIDDGKSKDEIIAKLTNKKTISNSEFVINQRQLEQKTKGSAAKSVTLVLLLLFSTPITIPLGIAFLAILICFIVVGLSLCVAAIGVFLGMIVSSIGLALSGSGALALLNVGGFLVAFAILSLISVGFIYGTIKAIKLIAVKLFGIAKKKEQKA